MSDLALIVLALSIHGLFWFLLVLLLLDQRNQRERDRDHLDALGNKITGRIPK